jgi:hypothetical protein
MVEISLEQVIEIQSHINLELKRQESTFKDIAASDASLIRKWQKFIATLLPVQLQVIQAFGYSGDQSGLSAYNENLMKFSSISEQLRLLNEDKWCFLLKSAFGLTEYRQISLQQARKLIEDIAEAMISEEFLKKVDQVMEPLDDNLSISEKRQELLEVLLPLHMLILSTHGFVGESGYIQAQRALMDYYDDPFIKDKASHAQKVVFNRAKLID